jgi:hypothetical protein
MGYLVSQGVFYFIKDLRKEVYELIVYFEETLAEKYPHINTGSYLQKGLIEH